MTLELQSTINGFRTSDSATFEWNDSFISGNNLYAVTSEPRFRVYNLETTANVFSDSSNGTGTYIGTTLISPASAIIANSGSNRFDLVNIGESTYPKGAITTNALAVSSTSSNRTQQIAGNPTAKLALCTRSTTGGVQLINGNTYTVTQLTPSQLSTLTAWCIINKNDNWLVGTSGGTVVEIASGGSVIQTVTIPSTPNSSTPSPLPIVSSLAYNNGYVLAGSQYGGLYLINWGASSVVDILPTDIGASNVTGTILSNSASGYVIAGKGNSAASIPASLREIDFSTGRINVEGQYILHTVNSNCQVIQIDPNTKKAVVLFDTTGNDALKILNMSSRDKIQVSTRVQDSGVDIPARIIRIKDSDNLGRSYIESDQLITAGENLLTASNGYSYVEIAINTGSPEKYDIREFRA